MSAKKVLNITILDGDGSEAAPMLKNITDAGLNEEYFVFVSVKPFTYRDRKEFAEMMEVAIKKLRGEPVPQPEHNHEE